MILTGKQLKSALQFIGSEENDFDDDREAGFIFKEESFVSTDGEIMPKGIYCYDVEYPDEGLLFLGES